MSSKIDKASEYIFPYGWRVFVAENRYIMEFINPGHGGQLFQIEIIKLDYDFAVGEKPKADEFMERISSVKGRNLGQLEENYE
jgi:hypothetical protein